MEGTVEAEKVRKTKMFMAYKCKSGQNCCQLSVMKKAPEVEFFVKKW